MAMPKLENNFKSITIAEVKETRIKVRQIIIQGSTIFSQEELNKIEEEFKLNIHKIIKTYFFYFNKIF